MYNSDHLASPSDSLTLSIYLRIWHGCESIWHFQLPYSIKMRNKKDYWTFCQTSVLVTIREKWKQAPGTNSTTILWGISVRTCRRADFCVIGWIHKKVWVTSPKVQGDWIWMWTHELGDESFNFYFNLSCYHVWALSTCHLSVGTDFGYLDLRCKIKVR